MIVFDILTIFPDFFSSVLEHGMVKRALTDGQAAAKIHNLRDYTHDRHRTVDDRPFGGGPGMILKPEPIFAAVEKLTQDVGERNFPVILLSATGRLFDQKYAARLSGEKRVVLICGRYEGVDERVARHLATDELSVGNFVLSGGELGACVVLDAVTRLLPGVLGNEESAQTESFTPDTGSGGDGAVGMLEFPQYTRPVEFRGWGVPPVLISGNHEEIRKWRRRKAMEKTLEARPDLLDGVGLDPPEEALLSDLKRPGRKLS